MTAVVSLREITRHNIDALLAMDAGDGGVQVASNAKSIAQASVCPEAWPRAVVAGELPVGFVMLYDPSLTAAPEENEFFVWRVMIDKAQHRQGYGRAAMQLLIEHVRTRPHQGELLLSIVEPAPQLLAFYGSLGFVRTERVDDGERVMQLAL